jgi:two-component system, NarL family, sensor histidine kinase YdfH
MAIFGKRDTIDSMQKRFAFGPAGFFKDNPWGAERPFFWMLTMAMIVITASVLLGTPSVREPARLIPFVALMVIHTALHWLSPRLTKTQPRWVVAYLIGQGLLAFLLCLMVQGGGLLLGLYMALVGEAFGMLPTLRWKVASVAYYLVLSAVNYLLSFGGEAFIWWVVAVAPMTFFVLTYVVLYTRQAEARDEAQTLSRKLEAANRQLMEYSSQVEDLTRAAERQRMARELHDTLAQGLAGLILQLEAANSHLASNKPERAQAIVQQAMARARGTLADARRAIDNLRAENPAPSDLAAAVQAEADRFTAATGLPCELTLALPAPLSQANREQALRTVTEALTNVARHAQARQVWVRLAAPPQGPGLYIEIRDDGCGFDPAAIAPGHYGLLGLRERARLANGRLDISSAPHQGTTVQLWLPADEAPGGPAL